MALSVVIVLPLKVHI